MAAAELATTARRRRRPRQVATTADFNFSAKPNPRPRGRPRKNAVDVTNADETTKPKPPARERTVRKTGNHLPLDSSD